MYVTRRPDVADDAFDVIGENGLTLEMTRDEDGTFRLFGLSGMRLVDFDGIALHDECAFLEWLDDQLLAAPKRTTERIDP
jgi:hypothetical protein